MLLWLTLPFNDFAVFDLSPLTVCMNCIFAVKFAVLLLVLSTQPCHSIHHYCFKTSQFKTVCKDDSGYTTQLKQQKSKR